MEKRKQWIALSVVGVLVVLAGGWFLLVSPKRTEASDIREQAVQQVSANAQLTTQLSILKAQAKSLPQQQAKLAAVAAKIPDNPALPALIRSLTKAAADAGVELVSLSPGQPVTAAAAAPTTPSAAGAAKTPSAAGANIGTLQSIAVTLNVVGGYFQVEQFFDRLEGLSRAMKVSTFSLVPGDNPVKPASTSATKSTLLAAITGTVFLSPGRPAAAPAVAGK